MEQRLSPDQVSDPSGRNSELIAVLRDATVTENGEERIRPDAMAFLMQAAQASSLARLRRLEESKIPTGTLSTAVTVRGPVKLALPKPLISFTLINDGPNGVYVEVNDMASDGLTAPVAINESFTFNAVYPIVEYLGLDVAAGESAALRIRGKTGRSLND